MSKKPENVFGTGIVYDGYGILLRGQSGAGKSLLALDLLDRAEIAGLDSYLISDDRVILSVEGDDLICQSPPQIQGQIELRGCGVITRPSVERTKIHLVIDLLNELDRMPENDEFEIEMMGVKTARCPVPTRALIDGVHQRMLVLESLRHVKEADKG